MKNIQSLLIAVSIGTLLLASGCSITMPVCATSNPVGSKVGKAKANIVLGLSFNADASIQRAAQNGNITKISTVDIKNVNVLGIYRSHKCIVTGE
jgi:hypothetical protein